MKIRKEFKVGVFAVIVILASWWGIKWLGGIDLFKSYTTYNVHYEKVSSDLQVSSRVYMRGVEVGNVRDITLKNDGVIVEIAIEEQYSDMVPENSIAMISEGMMGVEYNSKKERDDAVLEFIKANPDAKKIEKWED